MSQTIFLLIVQVENSIDEGQLQAHTPFAQRL